MNDHGMIVSKGVSGVVMKAYIFFRYLPRNFCITLITFYRLCISPLTPATCRFYPTCSEYALTSFRRYGFVKGSWLTIKRLSKCHPFHPGGYDPVP